MATVPGRASGPATGVERPVRSWPAAAGPVDRGEADLPKAESEAAPKRGSALVIGEGIEVKGEITSCETLVVEGRLEASVEVDILQLSQSGVFTGTATVDTAEVAGRFEGTLAVRGDLTLRPSARVDGKIRYGSVIIERGGEISGDVAVLRAATETAEPPAKSVAS